MNTNLMHPETLHAVNFDTFCQTMEESDVTFSIDMGGGVVIHLGTRYGAPIWLMDNPLGKLYGVWYDDTIPN